MTAPIQSSDISGGRHPSFQLFTGGEHPLLNQPLQLVGFYLLGLFDESY